MSNQIEQIRAEIERRNLANYCGTAEQYEEELFAILDTIEAEEKEHPIPSDIQEDKAAMDHYLNLPNSSYGEGGNLLPRSINDAFKAGAEWQRERLMKKGEDGLEKMIDDFEDWDGSYSRSDLPTSYTTRDIARFFANWQRERMMKEAVEIEVSNVGILQMGSILTDKGIFAGDTIQAIIIKKEK